YRAEDTNLSREVAIKVLPEQFTQDPQRLARFEREAKLLASLNHPNIAAIYGLEETEGVRFLALELVEGKTLAERVAKGPLPVEEALEVCRQIAEGVEAAHEKGVIHRDLKPANVKVTPEGKVKILDFGLAKAFEAETPVTDISQSPTLTEEMTRAGVILGTAAYMSPEQAKGEAVDKRADIFAFGCVLYELLTGKRTFDGKTITETLAKILEGEPNWVALPDTTPWRIQELLRRCLTKDVHTRLDSIGNVRTEIKLALQEPATQSPTVMVSTVQPPLWRKAIPWSITTVVIVLAGVGFWTMTRPTPEPLSKFVITPPTTAPVRTGIGVGNELAISPDGRRIVYLATPPGVLQLYVRSLDEFSATPIAGTEPASPNPFFSPDGESLAFFTEDGQLKKVLLIGGTPITLCEVPRGGRTGSWAEDTIVFSSAGSLYRVSAAGGEPETLLALDTEKGEIAYRDPNILPGGQALLFTILSSTGNQIALLSLETGEQKVLLAGRQARYAPTGHLVYSLSEIGTLMAAPFDLATLEVTGDSVPLLQEVRQTTAAQVDYSFSSNGTLVYVPDSTDTSTTRMLVWVDRKGQEEPLAAEPQSYQSPRISPDGLRLAITVDDSGSSDVWIYDLEREILTRLTFDPAADHYPVWTPDGRRIVFDSGRVGGSHNLFWKAADGTGQVERLATGPNNQTAYSFSSDGKRLVFGEGTPL
ncbi:MAG: protein kinase, partial [Anaerolineae bacterium]